MTVDGTFVVYGDDFLPEGIQNMSILETSTCQRGTKDGRVPQHAVTAMGGQEDITV